MKPRIVVFLFLFGVLPWWPSRTRLASTAELYYRVTPGDTLWGISRLYGTTVERLMEDKTISIASLSFRVRFSGLRPTRFCR